MQLSEALTKTGLPYFVPDCPRDNLPVFFVKQGFKVGAEIGVDKGNFMQKFIDVGLKMYAIDNWANKKQTYESVTRRFANNPLCTIVYKDSMAAVEQFASRSLDFVYIDADHRFPFVAQDLYFWYWRVRRGGIVAGHDYADTRPDSVDRSIQVKVIVDAFVKAFNIPSFYTFGRSKPLEEEALDDTALSYMFVKNW